MVTGLFIFIIPLSLFSQTSQALKPASMVNTTIQFKARYIFNFTKYIEWPANLRKGNFVIGVIGSPDLFRELIKISETKQIGNQPLEVKTFSSVESITYCHILYVVTDKVDIITAIQNKINSENTLLITDREGMIKLGAGINFVVINNKLEFELNRTGIQKVGLSVGSGLALLAVTVL
ncbi:MAG: YfiR family protein [Bacteroidetes bacterium]|nr:YfiR family protein [Bacteroidota bacterium]